MASDISPEESITPHLATFTVAVMATSFSFIVVNVVRSFMLPQLASNKWMVQQVFEYPIGWQQFVPITIAIYFGSTAIRSKQWVVSLLLAFLAMVIYYPALAMVRISGNADTIAVFKSLIDLKRCLLFSALWLNAALIILYCSLRRKRSVTDSHPIKSIARART